MHHILLVEDEPSVARGLEYGLRAEGFQTTLAPTGNLALDYARSKRPDLILLDLRLPDISGFDVCWEPRSDGMRIPILILTARDEEVDKVLGLELGADDYVVKPYSLRELISRVRALIRRAYGELSEARTGEKVQFGSVEIDMERLQVIRDGKPIGLTPIEFRLIRYLVEHPNQPISRSAIIQALWGYESDIGSERTIDVHIRHLRKKLEEDPANPRWIKTIRGTGYMFQA